LDQSLVIISGLPGTGKTTLAIDLADKLDLPLICIDDIVETHPEPSQLLNDDFWSQMNDILIEHVNNRLKQGTSVIVDSVFMGEDRNAVRRLARHYGIDFFAVHTHCSDKALWRARVEERARRFPHDKPATWDRIIAQSHKFQPWDLDDALFVDAVDPLEDNISKVINLLEIAE
jgi:predicted kinase